MTPSLADAAKRFAQGALADDPDELDEDWLADALTRFVTTLAPPNPSDDIPAECKNFGHTWVGLPADGYPTSHKCFRCGAIYGAPTPSAGQATERARAIYRRAYKKASVIWKEEQRDWEGIFVKCQAEEIAAELAASALWEENARLRNALEGLVKWVGDIDDINCDDEWRVALRALSPHPGTPDE